MPKLGILGGGQLAKMMAWAGRYIDIDCQVLDPAEDACAGQLCPHICADFNDQAALSTLAEDSNLLTFDFENVPVESVQLIADSKPVFPDAQALGYTQDRLLEKQLLRSLNIPTAEFHEVNSRPELMEAVDILGLPAVLKTRRMGYDGKGQFVLRQQEDLERAWQQLGDVPLILEQFVSFQGECSVIGARGQDGEVAFWPLSYNVHRNGVLAACMAPWGSSTLQAEAEDLMTRIMSHMNYVGVMALELFLLDNHLLANEIAPRVHNSGHWTIEGAVTSQFENHLRAVCGLPLGDTSPKSQTIMLNCLGTMPSSRVNSAQGVGVHWHDYGKAPRAGRKVGHITLTGVDVPLIKHAAVEWANTMGVLVVEAVKLLPE